MTSHEVKYQGPPSLAVRVATLLADAEGIDLTSAQKQEHPDGSLESVILSLTVKGTTEAVAAAVCSIARVMPAGAGIIIEDSVGTPCQTAAEFSKTLLILGR